MLHYFMIAFVDLKEKDPEYISPPVSKSEKEASQYPSKLKLLLY